MLKRGVQTHLFSCHVGLTFFLNYFYNIHTPNLGYSVMWLRERVQGESFGTEWNSRNRGDKEKDKQGWRKDN